MPISLSVYNTPGVYVEENTWGVTPAALSDHSAVYLLGYSSLVGSPKNIPTFVQSFDDFVNVFGSTSLSIPVVKAFFAQRTGSGLYFVNVTASPSQTLVLSPLTTDTVFSITVNGFVHSTTAVVGDTALTIAGRLATLVNQGSATVYLDGLVLKHAAGDTFSFTANIDPTVVAAPAQPDIQDVRLTLLRTFDADMPQGFVLAPEFFKRFTLASEQVLLQSGIEALCADPAFYWIGVIDCSNAVAVSTDIVRASQTERALLSSPKGHSSYYAPYLLVEGDVTVPASIFVVATALRALRDKGLQQPPAGKNYPLRGVIGLTATITKTQQSVINPLGINAIRFFPNVGYVIYGARTLSTNPFYRFYLVRLVLNILAGTLETAYDNLVLSGVDGLGTTFANIKGTGVSVCERLRVAGALYGATPDLAYRVVCDSSNNLPIDLENGRVAVDVIIVPTATLEVMVVRMARAAIGSPLTETVTGTVNTATTSITTPQVTIPRA